MQEVREAPPKAVTGRANTKTTKTKYANILQSKVQDARGYYRERKYKYNKNKTHKYTPGKDVGSKRGPAPGCYGESRAPTWQRPPPWWSFCRNRPDQPYLSKLFLILNTYVINMQKDKLFSCMSLFLF